MPQRAAPWISRWTTSAWRGAWRDLPGWPSRCAVCQDDTAGRAGRVCAACVQRFAPPVKRCARCALQLPGEAALCGACMRNPPPWTHAVAACDYGYPWDRLLGDFKFRAALDLGPSLARRLAAAVEATSLPAVDAVLPVPLAPLRMRSRGYNQAGLLAEHLAGRLGIACRHDWLLRWAETPHQIALPRSGRAANVAGVFAVEPLALPAVRGRTVALVDDVMTTGATAAALTRALLDAGAGAVQVWVVARTPP